MAQTPAQWRVNPSGNISNGEFTIAELGGIYAEKAEYARLIAAAPALLAALESFDSFFEKGERGIEQAMVEGLDAQLIEARAAILLAKQAP